MSRHVDPPTPPSRWTSSSAWKVCAVAPLAILCTLLLVKAVGNLAGSGAAPEAADVPHVAVADIGQTPRVIGADRTEKPRKKPRADNTSEAAEADPTTAEETTSSAPIAKSTPTRTPSPSDTPTTKPSPSSPSPSPSPTPTPEEAREACERAGVDPLDLPAMAACIAEAVGGS